MQPFQSHPQWPSLLLRNLLQEFFCPNHLNLYDTPTCDRLATQAAAGRQLKVAPDLLKTTSESELAAAVPVRLCEDDYPGWLTLADAHSLQLAETPYQAAQFPFPEIQAHLTEVITFAQTAMQHPNEYLWGGTVGPNYDCSGLIQAAFASVGIWLPRDAYQQEAFTQAIDLTDLQPGDLVFFGPPAKATHVGLYLGNQAYIHSSGKDQGRNGIGIDYLTGSDDPVSQTYAHQLRGAGRVTASYQPTGH